VKILNQQLLQAAKGKHRDAAGAIDRWIELMSAARWRTFLNVRQTFPATDPVKLANGRTVTVFDIKGNVYRLITTLDYQREIVAVWHFLTHAEYDREKWKGSL